MPALIAIFAVGAYGYGSALRGSDVIVNEVAIVRGAPDATEGSAQVYLGVFSPTRGTYQLTLPGGALLSAPTAGDFFAGQGAQLDVVQGDTARVRNLAVGFGSLRTVRAESAVEVPKIHADLQLVDGVIEGKIRNDSAMVLESPAVVLGGSVVVLADIPPGKEGVVRLRLAAGQFGIPLSDKLFGMGFAPENVTSNENQRRNQTRHRIVGQLTSDPLTGSLGNLPSDGPVLLAWGRSSLVDIDVQGQKPARSANVLYYIPLPFAASGTIAFTPDLIRSTVLAADAAVFSKDPFNMSLGQGSVTIAYRPIPFKGSFEATKVLLAMGFGETVGVGGKPIAPHPQRGACRSARDLRRTMSPRRARARRVQPIARSRGPRSLQRHLAAAPPSHPGHDVRADRPRELCRQRHGNDPDPIRERGPGRSRHVVQRRNPRGHPMTSIVRTAGLIKRYPGTLAVAGLDLDVGEGEIFGLVGPNGAGKTTTLRILATLLTATSGEAEVAGISVLRNPDEARRVLGFMPDVFGVYDDMKVWEYLDFFARCYNIPADRRRRMIGDLLDLVDLGDKRDAYVQGLSRGMQQRLCLAHTLVHDPQVLLLDEPASGLDPRARVELRELLRELRALGKTIVISSHILPELEELCTSVAIVDHGQVLAQGRVADIEKRLRYGAVLRVRVLGDGAAIEAARQHFATEERVASAAILDDGQIELGFRGDDDESAALLTRAVAAGIRVASFARAASDLEELFLQVTSGQGPIDAQVA